MEYQHSTFIQIPIVTDTPEKKYSPISIIPLRVCKVITINKGQGMTIGPQQLFEKVIAFLTTFGIRNSPGLELASVFTTRMS